MAAGFSNLSFARGPTKPRFLSPDPSKTPLHFTFQFESIAFQKLVDASEGQYRYLSAFRRQRYAPKARVRLFGIF